MAAELPPEEPDPDEIAERAAIIEFDGGLERGNAETFASVQDNEELRE